MPVAPVSLVNDYLFLVLFDFVHDGCIDECLDIGGIIAPGVDVNPLLLFGCAVPTRDNGLAQRVDDPQGLTVELDSVVAVAGYVLNLLL